MFRCKIREESERRARKDAEEASRQKDEFLATLSHELRTPMNAILGYVELIQHRSYDSEDELFAWLDIVMKSGRAQMRLIEDLLDVSRVVTGKLSVTLVPVDFGAVVESVVASVRAEAERGGIELRSAIAVGLRPVLGDHARLAQVVWNLLSNALKFTPQGGRVQVTLTAEVGGQVRLTVRDDGKGIDPAFLPHVFDRFRQEDQRNTRRQGGLGLGLALVQSLVAAHSGVVRAESDGPGRGSTFIIELPSCAAPSLRKGARDEYRIPRDKLDGVRVLVVDDSADVRSYVSAVLKRCGATALPASSAAEARRLLGASPIDVILCDIAMPGEGGYAFMRDHRARVARDAAADPRGRDDGAGARGGAGRGAGRGLRHALG